MAIKPSPTADATGFDWGSHQDALVRRWLSYNQYRWRFRRQVQPKSKRWKGLRGDDAWQKGYLNAESEALREIDFGLGNSGQAITRRKRHA
jgi:hypothetical protein